MKLKNLFDVSFKYENVRLILHIFIVGNNEADIKNKFNRIFSNHPIYQKEKIKILKIDKMKLGPYETEDVYI